MFLLTRGGCKPPTTTPPRRWWGETPTKNSQMRISSGLTFVQPQNHIVMQQHDFNFDESYGLVEFCDAVGNDEHRFRIQECTAEDGTSFNALAIPTSEKLEDGRTKFCFFTLSRPLTEKGEELTTDWLHEHKSAARLLEPIDGLKFGIVYLPGDALQSFDDL